MAVLGGLVNVKLSIPGMSCWFGGSHFFGWSCQLAAIPLSLLVLAPWRFGFVYR